MKKQLYILILEILFTFFSAYGQKCAVKDTSDWQKVEIKYMDLLKVLGKYNIIGQTDINLGRRIKKLSDLSESEKETLKKLAAKDGSCSIFISNNKKINKNSIYCCSVEPGGKIPKVCSSCKCKYIQITTELDPICFKSDSCFKESNYLLTGISTEGISDNDWTFFNKNKNFKINDTILLTESSISEKIKNITVINDLKLAYIIAWVGDCSDNGVNLQFGYARK